MEDLEGVDAEGNSLWRDCESAAGKRVWIGHNNEGDNLPREITLARAFELSAYAVTRRLYGLFDVNQSKRFKTYDKYSPDPRCPAIYLNWYDSMMFSIWCGGFLLTEWEWEYASRGKVYSNANTSEYFFGDNQRELANHAWFTENSEMKSHEVGHRSVCGQASPSDPDTRNGFGLYDMLGNVWEWGRNRYEFGVARSLRGGSFNLNAFNARCSYRDRGDPALASHNFGCRVARAKPRKS
jgi:formylglycine-generating enzyme required for sulfatase activity